MDFGYFINRLLDLLSIDEVAVFGAVLVISIVMFALGYLVGVLRNG